MFFKLSFLAYPTSVQEAHQYNQQVLQQHMIHQSHQYYAQQLRNQQHQQYSHLAPARYMVHFVVSKLMILEKLII